MNNPFIITEPTVISFSGGRTSGYMLYKVLEANNGLPDNALVCFSNTGKEDEKTLEFVRDCEKNWNVPITWIEWDDQSKFKTLCKYHYRPLTIIAKTSRKISTSLKI